MSDFLASGSALFMIRGESKSFELSVLDAHDIAVNLTDARVVLSVKRDPLDTQTLIRKSSDIPGQITITNARLGKAQIHFVPGDTHALTPGEYTYDVWVVFSSGKHCPVILASSFVVQPGVTLLPL